MGAFLSAAGDFLGRHWRLIAIAMLAAALAVQGRTLERVSADRDDWRTATGKWQSAAGMWRGAFGLSEGRRKTETRQARDAVGQAAAACDTRVAEARRSSRAITALITKEPAHDPQGCPVRQLLDPGQLRDALKPRTR